ncbi:DUF1022 domain-containing protein [hydrothermal vent metagenome]|uniref:DUF1022 domain-containing protein n=1 Tax=hydrothermal vent metagenome TaxID=652676 RepID=A0A3B0Y856_9ZZZZ
MTAKSIIVWRILDGKPGHENQTQGLVEALCDYVPVQSIEVPCQTFIKAASSLLWKSFPLFESPPDLIIGAGHRTHLSLLAARRRWKCPVIVLMKPDLPRHFFDMCIIPVHDKVKASASILITDGVLNRIKPDPNRVAGSGMLLIGGRSKHSHWSDQHVVNQIEKIINNSDVYFTIATSRRTPPSFVEAIKYRNMANLNIVLAEETGSDWLAQQLPQCEQAWVTEDSVSMVYEALSAGVACGVLQSSNKRPAKSSRVLTGLDRLKRENFILAFADWAKGATLEPAPELLAESSRCAKIIAEKWLIKN